jgi:NTP pyrophosphatase (non-canonical NTP hydrolase)
MTSWCKRGELILSLRTIVQEVLDEVARQNELWGTEHNARLNPMEWYAILGEEHGEVARAILTRDPDNYAEELVQVAAVCVNALVSHNMQRGQGILNRPPGGNGECKG